VTFVIRPFPFAQPLVSALEARAYFLLLRQKKVAKEKATLGRRPLRGFLALLGTPGGWLNSPAAQTPPADCSRHSCVAQRLSRGPANHPYTERPSLNSSHRRKPVSSALNDGGEIKHLPVDPGRLSGPHVERRATQAMAEKGRGLSEGRSPEFRSPRQRRVAQGSRQRRPRSLGSPFLWLLSFGEAKESTPANKAEPQANPTQPCGGKHTTT